MSMNRKILILFFLVLCSLLLMSPVVAKEKVKVKISTDNSFNGKAYITIELVNSHGARIHSKGTIHYCVTDMDGNYKWAYKPYPGKLYLDYPSGKYKVKVKFDGDSKYKKAKKSKTVTVKNKGVFNAYTYYDNHNWGLNQRIDDYIDDNYWDEEIYDDPYTYDGEGY